MKMENRDFELKENNEYTIKPYWKDIHVRAKYVGNTKGERGLTHVFVFEEDKMKKYVFIVDKHMVQEDGVFRYDINLSFPPHILSKKSLDTKSKLGNEQSKLLKILEDLGEILKNEH